jgi:transposase
MAASDPPLIISVLPAKIVDLGQFRNGRQMAAFPGLVPQRHLRGGKTAQPRIHKRSEGYLRDVLMRGVLRCKSDGPLAHLTAVLIG